MPAISKKTLATDIDSRVEKMMAVQELLERTPPGAFPSKDQIALLERAKGGMVDALVDAAWEGVSGVITAEPTLLRERSAAPATRRGKISRKAQRALDDEHAARCMVMSEVMGLRALAAVKQDKRLDAESVQMLPAETILLLTFAARKSMFRKLHEMRIDVRALPIPDAVLPHMHVDRGHHKMILEAFCQLEQGNKHILSMNDLMHLSDEQARFIIERIVEALHAFLAQDHIQLLLTKASIAPHDKEKHHHGISAVSELYHALHWLYEKTPGLPVLLSEQLLDRQPAETIGMIGTVAQEALREAYKELRLQRGKRDTRQEARDALDLDRPRAERVGASSDNYNRGKIDPVRDLPPNTVRLITDPKELRSMDDVIGLERAIHRLKPFVYRARRPDLIQTEPEHALLVGYYGVGKSLLAEALARQILEGNASIRDQKKHVRFAHVNLSNVFWKWVGESNANANRLMDFLEENAPIIVFLDELEAALNDPSAAQMHEESLRTQNTILQRISGMHKVKGVSMIGATNRPDLMHQAALRAGRFGRQIIVPMPGTDQLLHMFKQKRNQLLVPFEADARVVRGLLVKHTHNQQGDGSDRNEICDIQNAFTGSDIDLWIKILAEDHLIRRTEGRKKRPISNKVLLESYEQLLEDRDVRRATIEHRHAMSHDGATCSIKDNPAKDAYYRDLNKQAT